tara:strand:+ start:11215 stop:11916 length:702 start_codon:yes stop_codon:yes gene_type:complete
MTSGPPTDQKIIRDEAAMLAGIVPVAGCHVLEVGCGGGAFARKLASAGAVSVVAIDLPGVVPESDAGKPADVAFRAGRAEDLPLDDEVCDTCFMMKSLHHVPNPQMDQALREAARVLKPGGALVVCEPVAEGAFDEMIRPFHDEREVRRQAQEALDRCTVLSAKHDFHYLVPTDYESFDDFRKRMIESPTVTGPVTDKARRAARERYEVHASEDGSFHEDRRVHCRILIKPAL